MARNVWISGDWHCGHPNVIHLSNRPFESLKEMEDTIIRNVNAVVKEDDILYLVGDICLGNKSKWDEIFNQIICKNIILLQGNHCTWKSIPKDRFVCIAHSIHLRIFHQYFLLCHFPYRAPWWKLWVHPSVRKDPRRPIDRGLYLLHGHDHRATPFCSYHPRMVNVSVDAWKFKPVNMAEIVSLIQKSKKSMS
jgi:calcineurin-like phosphoesterase family protein